VTAPAPEVERRLPGLPAELVDSTLFLMARLGMALKTRAMEELERAEEDCSLYQYGVLALLAEQPRETQAAIADALNLDRSQLVGVLDNLEDRGLVERRRDPNDRRRHTVSLTPAGKKHLALMRAIIKRIEGEFLAPLDADARAALHDALRRLASNNDARSERSAT
jgi:DNA-binding MarR family transcriptional regulator